MVSHPSADLFAVLLTNDGSGDFPAMARLLAEPLDQPVVDLLQLMPARGGIIAENLPKQIAAWCVALLQTEGIAAQVLPQSDVVDPPELVTLRSGCPGDEVLFYVAAEQRGVVKWPEVIWVDLVAVDEQSMEEHADWEVHRGDERTTVRRFNNQRLVTKRPLFIDIVSYEPWRLLRIPQEQFEFTATGLPTFPTRRDNLHALVAMIATKATSASLGPGLDWIESRSTPREHRVSSHAIYQGFLRWQLTRHFLD